jgi:NAD(P)-dependent dehydrogenase (short-subunit alcohol dehydrogenase family)
MRPAPWVRPALWVRTAPERRYRATVDLGLRDRVAIVTGASRGIGRQVAIELAAEGCHLFLCGRDEAALDAVAGEVSAKGGRAVVHAADVASPGAAENIVARCREQHGRIDILVNNAGGGTAKRLERLTDDDWQDGFAVNFFAAARLAVACVPVMREQGWGRIVNVASTYGREPDPMFAPYAAAKAALLNLSKNLARAYSADGVLTNCVIPGITLTEMVDTNAAAAAEAAGITPDAVMAKMMAKDPVAAKRFGDTAEIAAAIVFLASERASWITGASLPVDGSTLRSY